MKKYGLELMLGCLLLVSFLILSKQAAEVSETMSSTENSKTIIVDAGIGRPSQACEAMEMGAAAVMANTAIATAGNVEEMAEAFKKAIEAGRSAYLSGLGRTIERGASASSPLTGFLED